MPYTAVSRSLWSSRKFRQLDDFERLFYFYLLTNEQVTALGVYRFHPGHALFDMEREELDLERIMTALNRLQAVGLIQYDSGERLLRLVNFLTFHPPCGPKHAGSLCNTVAGLPPGPIKERVTADLLRFEHIRRCKAAEKLKANGTGMDTGIPTGMDTGGYTDPSRTRALRDPTTPHPDHDPEKLILKKSKEKKDSPVDNSQGANKSRKETRAGMPKTVGEHLASALERMRRNNPVTQPDPPPSEEARPPPLNGEKEPNRLK